MAGTCGALSLMEYEAEIRVQGLGSTALSCDAYMKWG